MDRDAAFTEYVARRRALLYRTACLLCGDPHRAEDVVQDALARLYAGWARASRADSIDAYARRVVVNAHYHQARRPWRRERVTASLRETAADPGMPSEDSDALWAAVRCLPPRQRQVVVLRHFWGLSVDETAADLGVTAGTVKRQTSDALAALRRALAGEFDAAGQGEDS